tara:strand:- start:348 stop:8849 length:8502 start_codon:yes stop_codon:yes gene_type:complete
VVEPGFRPSLSPQQVKDYRRLYDQQPDKFDDQTIEALEQHATYYKLPFAENNDSFMGKVGSVMKQTGAGFFEGFTTFKTGDPPTDDAEAIARNIGHLAGFVGYVPSMPLKAIGAIRLAQAAKRLRGASVPMWVAGKAEKGVKKIINPIYGRAIEARAAAGKTATGFLQNNVVKDMASGAFHLGVASAVSSWQGGVDEMMDSFKHGAITGAAFRAIGNAVQTGSPQADKMIRGLSASLMTGLPSTMRGETTPMQIYQYLLGAYFGVHEMPVHRRMGQKHLAKMIKKGEKDPELIEGWHDIDKPGQNWVVKQVERLEAPKNILAAEILKNVKGITPEEAELRAEQYLKKQKELESISFTEEGEPLRDLTKEELKEMEDSGADVDPQIIPSRLSINAKSFVDNNMAEYMKYNTTGEKLVVASDLNDKWLNLIQKGRKDKKNPANEMLDYIGEKYPEFSTQKEDKAFWQGLGFMRIKQRPVNMLTINNGKPRVMKTDNTGSAMNDAGNRKQLSQEPKLIEEVFLQDYNRKFGMQEKTPRGVYALLDHIVKGTPTGMREFELNKYTDYLAKIEAAKEGRNFPNKEDLQLAQQKYNREIGNLMGFMNAKKRNMYYYGGRGDASRLYFVKYHPDTPFGKANVKKAMTKIKAAMRKNNVTAEQLKEIDKSRQDFIKKYGSGIGNAERAGEMFDKAYVSNAIYDARLNGYKGLEDISKVLGEGYINNAKAFNKRSQIWFTSGYSSDPEVLSMVVEKAKGKGKSDIVDDKLNIKLIEDIGKEVPHKIGTANSKYFQSGDGAIYGRSDIIDGLNRQGGLPEEGGVNKSFIVSSDPQYGALLGKYMIHSVTPKMEKYMQDNNIHLIIPKSSVKQVGDRKVGTIDWVRKKPVVNAETYQLPIRDIKVVMSEKTDSHSLQPQHMPKQMFTNFTPYGFFDPSRAPFKTEAEYNESMNDIFSDMYSTLSEKRVKGDTEYNQLVERLVKNPSAYEEDIPKIVNNLNKVGVHELLAAIQAKGNEKFANAAYSKIQKLNRNVIEEMRADGEHTDKEIESMRNEMSDFETVHERINSLVPDSLAGFLHKFSRDYRMSVVRNYIVNGITRPEIGNSGSTRMRPYEIGMSKEGETKRLEKEDDIFFLDNGFKNMMVDVSGLGKKGKRSLEELWKTYEEGVDKGTTDKQLEELFRAILVRVPMDSMSGAHALKFAGFTGVRGFGSLLHGRTMESLGGADLDGDKAFVFFGGRSADGKGEGFKKEWKDAYDWSKNEFVKDGFEEHNKDTVNPLSKKGETYHDELTVSGPIKDQVVNKALQYSPVTRQIASDAASQGRNQLGTAVTQASYVRSAYSAIRAMKNSSYYTEIYHKDFKHPLRLRVRARKGDENLRSFRGVSRAAVGLASDPMDEAGLNFGKYGEKLLNKQTDALFEYMIVNKNGKPMPRLNKIIHSGHKKKAVINSMKEINQAIYSRNWAENRRFQMWEIQEKLERIDDPISGVGKEQRNTFLPKLATDLKGLDWSDGILKRIDYDKISKLYKDHEESLFELDPLKEVLGRKSLAVPRSPYLDLVMKYRLFTKEGMRTQLDPNNSGYQKDIISGKQFVSYNKGKREKFDPGNLEQRSRYLNDIVKKAEDFVVNDFSDIASIKRIKELSKGISPVRIQELSEAADYLKKNSYVLANQSRKIDNTNSTLDPIEIAYLEAAQQQIYGEKQSSALNQASIDSRINKYKENLAPEESKLFDALMLGTLWRGRQVDLDVMYKRIGEPKSDEVRKEVENMVLDSKKTSLSRVGYASQAIPDASVKAMLNEYQKLFDYSIEVVKPGTAEKIIKDVEKLDQPMKIVDSDGKRVESQVVEDPNMDSTTKKYLDEHAPFVGLHRGKLNKEEAELALSIQGHLAHYNNIVGKDLNGLMRWLVKKDLNNASLEDFKTLDRWFQMTREGTWWQKIMRPVLNNSPKISRWHHLMFPKAIGQDLMRYDLALVEARQPYKDKYGWVTGKVMQPENMMTKMQSAVHTMNQQATQLYEENKRQLDEDLRPYLEGVEGGDRLFRISVRQREFINMPKRLKEEGQDSLYNIKSREYIDKWNDIQKEYDWANLQNKVFNVTLGGGRVAKMTGKEIVKNIDQVLTKWNEKIHGWMTGGRDAFGVNEWDRLYAPQKGRKDYTGDYYIVENFLKKFNKAIMDGKRVDLTEGIDGLREISKSQMIAYYPKAQADVKKAIQEGLSIQPTGDLGAKGYWPHMGGDSKIAAEGLKRIIKQLTEDPFVDKEVRKKEIAKALYHYRQITGDWVPTGELNDAYNLASDVLKDIATKSGKKSERIRGFTENRQVGAQHKRDAHIPGWSVEPEVYSMYMKSVIDNMYKHAAQIKVRSDIHKFQGEHIKKTGDSKSTFEWVDFFNLYAQDALGYPQHIPQKILDNPNMKIKGTPFAWWNDTNVKNRVNGIRNMLGIGKKKDAELPEELRGVDFGQLARWGNLEAKYQLASLLAHPKSAVANLYGGTAHTLISTGMTNFKNARSIKYLQTNINPEWKNMADVEKWVRGLGVVEDFIIYEAGLNPKFKNKRFKDFLSDATAAIKKDPNVSDRNLRNIANRHGIIDSVFNKAAWFMRRPERTLRRDAFMAHYLQGRNNFEGAITRFDDPILIKLGMEGVKSTQFLYSAPFRPAFARSTMGKVMTRFQLWAWNSVRFRNETIREASLRGWKQGTPEFERFKRMATMDLLMFGLANVFMYSLFENALPQPYGWVQDWSDWAFGSDKERSRAFFGSYPSALAPLQMITPPALRLVPGTMKAIIEDDWSKLAGYQIWSMFPFGRMGNDVFGEYGLMTNPSRAIEKLTGIPYQQIPRQVKKYKDDPTLKPRIL